MRWCCCPPLLAAALTSLLVQLVAFHTTLAQGPGAAAAADWPAYSRSYSGQWHSPLRQLTLAVWRRFGAPAPSAPVAPEW